MGDLIETLREQHWQIGAESAILNKFCEQGLTSSQDIEKWMEEKSNLVRQLAKFKATLLGHLKIEDKYLYPSLLNSKKKKIITTSNKFSNEMIQISKKTLSFFEKYAHLKVDDLTSNEDFRIDLLLIISIIKKRIEIEESQLYPIYYELSKSEKIKY